MGPATAAARGFCIVFLAAWVGAQVRADFSLLACVFLLQLSQPPARAVCSCMPAHARPRTRLYVFTHRTTTLRGKLTSWKIKSRPSLFSSPTSRCPIQG